MKKAHKYTSKQRAKHRKKEREITSERAWRYNLIH
jgi:hypothetical protein